MRTGEEIFLGEFDIQDLDSDQFDQGDHISGFPVDPESSADWELSFPVSGSGQLEGPPGEAKLKL